MQSSQSDVRGNDALVPFEAWPAEQVHVEWGPIGARHAAERGDVVVVVDVLSFSTTVTIAIERGVACSVLTRSEVDELGGVDEAARLLGVQSPSKSRVVKSGQLSLSSASFVRAATLPERILITSLNGAATVQATIGASSVIVGGLRNATAVAKFAMAQLDATPARRISVIACGERWSSVSPSSDGYRPSLEDWLGAGAICARLGTFGLSLSAEAKGAAMAWEHEDEAFETLGACVSARELIATGFQDDVQLAYELDVSKAVPIAYSRHLGATWFRGAGG